MKGRDERAENEGIPEGAQQEKERRFVSRHNVEVEGEDD
jgi:hypothetical protein